MKLTEACGNYFNGFNEIFNALNNDAKTNFLAVIKILSYLSVVIPLGVAVVYGGASLLVRAQKKRQLNSSGYCC